MKINEEIHYNFKYPDKATVIKGRRLEWLGHVAGIDGEARRLYKVLDGKQGGGRRWADVMDSELGLRNLGVKSCGRRKLASVVRKT